MTAVIKRCRSEKRCETKIDEIRKKLIPRSEISECPEYDTKSNQKQETYNEKILEEYSVKIYEIDPYFYEHYGKKYKLMKMGVNICYLELMLILLNISQPQKLMKKVILTETLFLRRKDKKHQKKNFILRINTSKEGYDADYEASRIQTFISKFKGKQLKKLNKKLKELEDKIDKIEKLTGQIPQ